MPAPTGVKSNIRNGSPSRSSRIRETMTLGEVPTRVMRPPSSEPNAIGINSDETEVPVRRACWNAIGIMIAKAPTFLTKADRSVTTPTSTTICRPTVVRCGAMGAISRSVMPERATAALSTKALATMMTISSPKPLNAASGGTIPTTVAASSAASATRS